MCIGNGSELGQATMELRVAEVVQGRNVDEGHYVESEAMEEDHR